MVSLRSFTVKLEDGRELELDCDFDPDINSGLELWEALRMCLKQEGITEKIQGISYVSKSPPALS